MMEYSDEISAVKIPLLLAGLTALLMLLPVVLRTGHINGWHGLCPPSDGAG